MFDNKEAKDSVASVAEQEELEANKAVDDFLDNPFGWTEEERRRNEEELERWEAEQSEKAKSSDRSVAIRRILWPTKAEASTGPSEKSQNDQEDREEPSTQCEGRSEQPEASGDSGQASGVSEFKPRRSARISARNFEQNTAEDPSASSQ